jgi:hypothetical protein
MRKKATDEDHNLKVLGDIEVASVQMYQWVNVLTKHDETLEQRFRQLYEAKGSVLSAILALRKQMFAEGYGNIEANIVWDVYNKEDCERLRWLTEEIFLESISFGYLKTLIKVAKENWWRFEQVLEVHNTYKEKRIWQIICCKNPNPAEEFLTVANN